MKVVGRESKKEKEDREKIRTSRICLGSWECFVRLACLVGDVMVMSLKMWSSRRRHEMPEKIIIGFCDFLCDQFFVRYSFVEKCTGHAFHTMVSSL